ncbi:NAD+ diphosphatase [Malonomonas rubra DSM 5091]|uniref:NAD(+) diphosphatase n=1 Tax=Malonomonas rubra DSM 5091 TaxID=1122189 RepID=A0A1M6J927_MALRU|nr:NAD(+) diphosphatase [Malonomonas rubra]SHJ43122.1 NAD+ diphosphatase [Malonomonas rubra DSM 5091]
MTLGYPDSFPSTDALPFNSEAMDAEFELATPGQDPGGEGFWLPLQGAKVFTCGDAIDPQLPFGKQPGDLALPSLYIGQWLGKPCRMIILDEPLPEDKFAAHSLHAANPQAPISLLSLAGLGLMIQHWEESSRHCGYCGTELQRIHQEWGKRCPNCNKQHYPRIHPCVIGLVVKEDEILLVRKPEWVPQRFGLVAGFVEFGESLEQAMAREILEETGIIVDNLRYVGSQSWPFPSQIMNGFVADYVSGEIKLQETELEEGGWYKLDQLPTLPPRRSIARYLIDMAENYIA